MNVYFVITVPVAALCALLICAAPAYAYLDPATGSMVIQAVIAGVAAVSVSVGIFWKRLKSFFDRNKENNSGDK